MAWELVHADDLLRPALLVVIPMVPLAQAGGSSNQDEAEIAMLEDLLLSVEVDKDMGGARRRDYSRCTRGSVAAGKLLSFRLQLPFEFAPIRRRVNLDEAQVCLQTMSLRDTHTDQAP
jgi:hypothetical protein